MLAVILDSLTLLRERDHYLSKGSFFANHRSLFFKGHQLTGHITGLEIIRH